MIKAVILGSIMIVMILLLRALFGKCLPRICFKLLWALAAIRLLLPFSFTFDVEIEVPAEPIQEKTRQGIVLDTSNAIPANVQTEPIKEVKEPEKTIGTADILLCVHVIGTALSGGFMAYAYLRMRRTAIGAKALPTYLAKRWDTLTVRHGDGFSSPFSCGVIKAIIFIPSHMLTLDVSRLDNVIAHEKQHIRACDQLYKWLIAAAACLHWYNPLVWMAVHFASRDAELACDEAVVKKIGKRADYAMTLIEAEEKRASFAVCSFGAPVLSERIEFIMKSKKTTMCGFVSAGAVLAAMTVFFIGVNATYVEPDVSEEDTDIKAGNAEEITVAENDEYTTDVSVYDIHHDYDITSGGTHPDDDVEETTVTVNVDAPKSNEPFELVADTEPESAVEFFSPLEDHNGITCTFGEHTNLMGHVTYHNGVNVAADKGSVVYAAADGTVILAEYSFDAGNTVTIDHGNGCVTSYTYLEAIDCEVGDEVLSGENIATVGATGMATGPNLGFSVLVDGAYVDPAPLFE